MSKKTPSDATKRQTNYTRKVDPARIGTLITGMKYSMANNLDNVLSTLEAVYTGVQAVLSTEDTVTVFLATAYQNFARQIWYAKNGHSGTELQSEVTAISQDWHTRGLDSGIITRIIVEVFGISAPGTFDGVLNLTATPSDATYSISPGHGGSVLTGTCPIHALAVNNGVQTITLSKALYKNWVAAVTFASGQHITLAATLELA